MSTSRHSKAERKQRRQRIRDLKREDSSRGQNTILKLLKVEFPGLTADEVKGVLRQARRRGALPPAPKDQDTAPAAKVVLLPLDSITVDPELQPRQSLDEATVVEYQQALDDGDALPPGIAFHDGDTHWLADGFHRREGHRRAGRPAMPVEVRTGTRRDALLYAAGANVTHGLKRSDADKRRQVLILLRDEEWRGWVDREIARHCQVSPTYVGKLRRDVEPAGAPSLSTVDSENGAAESTEQAPKVRTYRTKHGAKAKMRVGRIGKGKKKRGKARHVEPEEARGVETAAAEARRQQPEASCPPRRRSPPEPLPSLHECLESLRISRSRVDELLAVPAAEGTTDVFAAIEDEQKALDVFEAIGEEMEAASLLHEALFAHFAGVPVEDES